jgi:hypothetical protein
MSGILFAGSQIACQTRVRSKEHIQVNKIILGPYFCVAHAPALSNDKILPLGFRMEWASATKVVGIPLFRRHPGRGPGTLRLEHLLFARRHLPFELECSSDQVVKTPTETLLPLEALLAALYDGNEVSRSILQVLAELVSKVAIHSRVSHGITMQGLLVPRAEAAGFRLNMVIRDGDRFYAEIGWQPAGHANRFHTSICRFQLNRGGLSTEGVWLPAGVIGVASLLAREFHHVVPGLPREAFSLSGISLLRRESSPSQP